MDTQIDDPHATYMRYIILAAFLVVGCDISAPARKTAALERRIAELEDQLAAKDVVDRGNAAGLDDCVAIAERAYWQYIYLNGRRAKRTPTGEVWRARPAVWNQAALDKTNAIEICKAVWKKGN